jgi:hypothetical protein
MAEEKNTKHDPKAEKPREAHEVDTILPKSHGHAHLAEPRPREKEDLARWSGTGVTGAHDMGTRLIDVRRSFTGDLAKENRPASRVWDH